MNKIELLKKKKLFNHFYSLKKKILFKNKKSNKLIVDNTKIDSIGNNVKKVKVRNAGVDLVRILSMFAIIIQHILNHGRVIKKYRKYRELILMSIACYWNVSTYALISGYVGYNQINIQIYYIYGFGQHFIH